MIRDIGNVAIDLDREVDRPSSLGELSRSVMVNQMAISMARELSEKWPFEVRRVRVSLFGVFSQRASSHSIGAALVLGLSGIDLTNLHDPDRAQAFRRRDRMMAVRLSRRSLVAFHPDRDVDYVSHTPGLWPDRVRINGLPVGHGPVRFLERMARPNLRDLY